ncbi:MAG: hypothetical protein ACKO96_08885, partial [Flammeovirgaceae bacterium]
VKERFGDAIQQVFGVNPDALTNTEAEYLANFRDVDSLRARVATARLERRERLLSKGIQQVNETPPDGGVSISSPAFRKWFGDSKVVDENGKPLVVYHGTRRDVSNFDSFAEKQTAHPSNELGFFFAKDPKYADDYASNPAFGDPGGANIVPVYLSLQNPWITTAKELYGVTQFDGNNAAYKGITLRRKLIEQGYDGIIASSEEKGDLSGANLTEMVAFYPTQIKSAIGNRGTFD